MTRTLARLLAFTAVMAVACTGPTEVCGCSPQPEILVVTGHVTDAADAPVAGARVAIDAVPATFSSEPPFPFERPATTGADGSFAIEVFDYYGAPELALRAGVVRAGTTDTVRVRLVTMVAADAGGSMPDTVNVTLKLP